MTNSYVNLRTEAGFKLHNRLNTTHPVLAPAAPSPASCCGSSPPRVIPERGFDFCPGAYYARLWVTVTYGTSAKVDEILTDAVKEGPWP